MPSPTPSIGHAFGSKIAAVEFKNQIYVFYVDPGSQSIWCMTGVPQLSESKITFSSPYQLMTHEATIMSIAEGSSPSAAVHFDQLYVFYNGKSNEIGKLVTHYSSTEDGLAWATLKKVHDTDLAPGTSPSAAVHWGALHLFWTTDSSQELDGVIQWATLNGHGWTEPATTHSDQALKPPGGSPYAISFGGSLFMFYNEHPGFPMFNRLGDMSTIWEGPYNAFLGPKGMQPPPVYDCCCNPSLLVLAEDLVLRLCWVNTTDKLGVKHVDYRKDNETWTSTRTFTREAVFNGMSMSTHIDLIGVSFQGVPCLLWQKSDWRTEETIIHVEALGYELDTMTFDNPARWFREDETFTVTVNDKVIAKFLRETFGTRRTCIYSTKYIDYRHPDTLASKIVRKIYNNIYEMPDTIATKISVLAT